MSTGSASSTAKAAGPRKQPTAVSRMKQDYMRLKRDPLPYITAEPLPNNILEWHYCIKGPENTPYYGGYYHGTLLFPREFPFKPPSIYMLTPNGRFKTNMRLCLSISDFHPDTWNPTWCVGTILQGLLSFMLESTHTLGAIESTNFEKQIYAKNSLAFNLKNETFDQLFPDIVNEIKQCLKRQQKASNPGATSKAAKDRADYNNSPNGIGANGGNLDLQAADDVDPAFAKAAHGPRANRAVQPDSSRNSYINRQSCYSNIIIILCVAIFALIVNYVIKYFNQQ